MSPSRTLPLLLVVPLGLIGGASALGQSQPTAVAMPAGFSISPNAVYLEEEWQLSVPSPDPDNDGPQVKTYMSLVQDTSEPYLWFMLNVRDKPGPFSPGGMQVQRWNYDEELLDSSTYDYRVMSSSNEVVTWRQRMSRPSAFNNVCTFEICNGSSLTWGNFGNTYIGYYVYRYPGPNRLSFTPNASMDFSRYNPLTSVQMSRVSWEFNRVGYLRLLNVRQYDVNGSLLGRWSPKDFSVNADVDLTK